MNENALPCSHGTRNGDLCLACMRESRFIQPAWQRLTELLSTSKYVRSAQRPECTIQGEGRNYLIELVRPDNDGTIQAIQKLLEETFGEEEVDPVAVLKAAIEGKLRDGTQDVARYRLYTARDQNGKVQSVYAGGLVAMVDGSGSLGQEMMFMGAYGVTRPQSRRKGLVRELYVSSIMHAAVDAQADGKRLTIIAGETTSSSEKAWNAVGRRRVYAEVGANEYSELQYFQPALEFDQLTGLPAEGAGEAAEHIMVEFLEGEPDKERLVAAIDAIYRWCNLQPRNLFTSDQAYEVHREYLADIQRTFNFAVFNAKSLLLLSLSERNQLRREEATIHEHTDADR